MVKSDMERVEIDENTEGERKSEPSTHVAAIQAGLELYAEEKAKAEKFNEYLDKQGLNLPR
jgi:hypothetical protein